MVSVSPSDCATYAAFKQHPVTRFESILRRTRARQIRALLSDAAQVSLEMFTREVWRFGPAIEFQGLQTHFYGLNVDKLPPGWLAALEQGVQDGSVALHGNYMFSQPMTLFDPGNPDVEAKTEHVRQAVRIVNDESLTPAEKAHRIMAVPGFGPSNATALVCIFHPKDYAVCNKRSIHAVNLLARTSFTARHIPEAQVQQFQKVAHELKKQLGADDFLELDCFFDQVWFDEAFVPIPDVEIDDAELPFQADGEWRRALRNHWAHERSKTLVKRAKERFKQERGRLSCEACEFDFFHVYGALGEDFIEVHHLVPVSELREGDSTRLSDVALVCSNCHRMLHRGKPVLDIDELRSILEERTAVHHGRPA
jgi:hypothetical protein